MNKSQKVYYRVISDFSSVLIPRNHHAYGYEFERDFVSALRTLHQRWRGRTGQQVETKRNFILLKFSEQDGTFVRAWLPDFMLVLTATPADSCTDVGEPESELEKVFGRGW